tara:strand:+ start:1417 stop:2661 length:1245 start_codon:yes stop_codon:yes gene_type:complete
MISIGVIGLGYVGLPVSLEFSKKFNVIGFDKKKERIDQLKKNIDINKEFLSKDLKKNKKLIYTNDLFDLKNCNVYIITVPTPIKKNKTPDLKFINYACNDISKILKKNDVIIIESTVYPGMTENYIAKKIQNASGLIFNFDFFIGYSPERINPGDKKKKLRNIIKLTSGSNYKTAKFVDNLYKKIISAGTYKVDSIQIAEAAKIIENIQRDINIAFINELSFIFDKMKIPIYDVLRASSTKWNFLNFKPGLVGGHCIGVDPYYLTSISKKFGYNPKMILAGRSINDNYGRYIANKIIFNLKGREIKISKKVLIMGFSFKENCPDVRNTKVIDIYNSLIKKNIDVDIFDPIANPHDTKKYYNVKLLKKISYRKYDSILIAVKHNYFKKIGYKKIINYGNKKCFFYDLKNLFENIN